ncbi:hypothetical protein T492DRAFT_897147 [Pavlovales sp. CCMP2436]|nr:hypothetical protein T492DRAFT_897147 [Pavlovales sp. CCMP2436]
MAEAGWPAPLRRAASALNRAAVPLALFRRASMPVVDDPCVASRSEPPFQTLTARSRSPRKSIVRQTFNPAPKWTARSERDEDDDIVDGHWHSLGMPLDALAESGTHREPLLGAQQQRASGRAACTEAAATFLKRLCAFMIMSTLIMIECVPFGLAFFPHSFPMDLPSLPVPRTLGIQLFLLSSAIGQAVFALQSRFEVATGLMMCENIPFMAEMARDVREQLGAQGREDEKVTHQ